MAEVLQVTRRETLGKRNARRLRRDGKVPAILYGHGEENLNLSLAAESIETAIRHGARLVQLAGEVDDQALIKDLQWDTWGTHVLHIDFTRVSAGERVHVELPVEIRGEAPGANEGGLVSQTLHSVHIDCPAVLVPEKLQIRISSLALGESLSAGDIELPEGATLITDQGEMVVHCVEPTLVSDEGEVGESAEPEIIRKESAEDGDEA